MSAGALTLSSEDLDRVALWSLNTFGPGPRTLGVVDHIKKELKEILDAPDDIEEWADVIILGIDGAMRAGADGHHLLATLKAKYEKNFGRLWPDWRLADPNRAIEHVRNYVDEYRDGMGVE